MYWFFCSPALPMRLAIAHLALVNPELQLQPLLTHPHHHHHCHHLSKPRCHSKDTRLASCRGEAAHDTGPMPRCSRSPVVALRSTADLNSTPPPTPRIPAPACFVCLRLCPLQPAGSLSEISEKIVDGGEIEEKGWDHRRCWVSAFASCGRPWA